MTERESLYPFTEINSIFNFGGQVKVKVKHSRYRPLQAQRGLRSYGS